METIARDGEIGLAGGAVVKLAQIRLANRSGTDDLAAAVGLRPGQRVLYRKVEAEPDRWGRILAQMIVFTEGKDPQGEWLEARLVGAGLAVVAPDEAGRECAAALLRLERGARAAGRGVWGEGGLRVLRAGDVDAIAAEAGRPAIVEGRILSVGVRASRTYLNFGRRWSEDFTVTVPKRLWDGIGDGTWRGRRVRVRGIVENAGGPMIAVRLAEQVETLVAPAEREGGQAQ